MSASNASAATYAQQIDKILQEMSPERRAALEKLIKERNKVRNIMAGVVAVMGVACLALHFLVKED